MKILTVVCLLAALASVFNCSYAGTWCFVVAGDGRTDPKHSPDPTGINTPVFRKILQSIAQQKPKFMLFTGDLVSGELPGVHDKIAEQFKAWKNLVKTELPDVPVLPVRGNHETIGDKDGKIWLAEFKPLLDASAVRYFKGEEGFSYSYSPPGHPAVTVIAVDQFQPGQEHRVNLPELEKILKQTGTNGQIFVCGHEMAFTCSSHKDSENLGAFPEERGKFVYLLQQYGCKYYFAGHDHCYDWMEIWHPGWRQYYSLIQVVAGTAGAPFYEDHKYFGDHYGYDLIRRDHLQQTHGYILVVVDDADPLKANVKFVPVNP